MGNQGSQLGDEPGSIGSPDFGGGANINKNIRHFDHTFKGELHTTSGNFFAKVFGDCKFSKREIQLTCRANSCEIIEEIGIKSKKNLEVPYQRISQITWDHNNSEVKIDLKSSEADNNDSNAPTFVILTMSNTIELEGELKLRLNNPGGRPPTTMYVGMFAGESKPKPFQRKRPNLSKLPPGKLPLLHDMRVQALQLHKGSYRPCAPGVSRRLELAVQHIHEGCNIFGIIRIRGVSTVANQWRPESVLLMKDEMLSFRPGGMHSSNSVDIPYEEILDYRVEDNDHVRPNDSGIEFVMANGGVLFFIFPFVRDVKHTLEFYWNLYQVLNNKSVKLGSTHGRPLVTVTTLSGEVPATESPQGNSDVVDMDGIVVRPGGKMVPRARQMSMSGLTGGKSKEILIVPNENRSVKPHWGRVVLHQGWLLKKGGIGLGPAKSWIKRYFVLYKTSQGHFLVYYADFTECPLYSTDKGYRNVVDLAKATFIRPGSIKSEAADTPPNSFDIVTTEREWTLCAETQDNAQKWLMLLTRAVDEDVAILPDEELLFKVKPKVDPTGLLPAADYTTAMRVSAHGISVCIPDTAGASVSKSITINGGEREVFFWVYTDFYKWSLLSQAGKLALLVNVFADASFTRRNEFIFRNKEAVRLATSIEYFIEKFMCVMHIRLEDKEGAFDDVPLPSPTAAATITNTAAVLAEPLDGDEQQQQQQQQNGMNFAQDDDDNDVRRFDEVDLLDLDLDSGGIGNNSNGNNSGISSSSSSYQQQQQQDLSPRDKTAYMSRTSPRPISNSADPFTDTFGSSISSDKDNYNSGGYNTQQQQQQQAYYSQQQQSTNLIDDDDLLGIPVAAASVYSHQPPPQQQYQQQQQQQQSSQSTAAADVFGNDDDFFGSGGSGVAALVNNKTAPLLTEAQIATHAQWFRTALTKHSGSFYDDGSLQIAVTVEVRGSQGRVTFFFRNQSPGALTNFQLHVEDAAGLTRFDLGPGPAVIEALSNSTHLQQQLMIECMKPVAAVPTVTIAYTDTLVGNSSNTLPLPLVVTSFNDPLALTGLDFTTRWESLTAPGLQAQEVFHPALPVIPAEITAGLSLALKFGVVRGVPGESEFVVHGAASLRTGTPTPTGDKISIGCLAKVEMNVQTNAIRFSVRTLHPAATAAIMATAKSLLG